MSRKGIKTECPKCEQGRSNCFAYRSGKCNCLEDTNFEYKCPFYKDRRDLKKGKN